MFKRLTLGSALAAIMLVISTPAKADTVVLLNGATLIVSGPDTGDYLWSYEAKLQVGEETSEAGASVSFPTFFTIYDVGGLVAGSETQPANWAVSAALTGVTPSGVAPTDSSTIPNITWTYSSTATQIVPAGADTDLGAFTFVSTQGNNGLVTEYSQQATKNNPGQSDDDTRDAGVGSVIGPSGASVTPVPEPGTLTLLISSLVGLGWTKRRR